MDDSETVVEKRKRMSCGVYVDCPDSLKDAIQSSMDYGFHFIITQLCHPKFSESFQNCDAKHVLGRSDRMLKSNEWSRLVVGELSTDVEVDEVCRETLNIQLGFASHLGLPAILVYLKSKNTQLARIITDRLIQGVSYAVWVQIPMGQSVTLYDDMDVDMWEVWHEFHTFCDYDKKIGVVLEIPDVKDVLPVGTIDRWIGEPVKALVLKASHFLINQYGKPVLSKLHQEIIRKFMPLDVQYVIHLDVQEGDFSQYVKYMNFLGKKLYVADTMAEFAQGCEDYLQNPLQPLSEHLEATIYEVFEKDQVKYDTYQEAVHQALQEWVLPRVPVVMVVGAGRGPLVQAVLNVSAALSLEVKIYAVEKNPFAMNTLVHRNKNEWNGQVILVKNDMRNWESPELADILVSELLGSFGDNELSPECLDGAQRFLRPDTGISIPRQYTSYVAPIHSIKIYNEVRHNKVADKSLKQNFETPYVVHLSNYHQLATAEALFQFDHPVSISNNRRYKSIRFPPVTKSATLTGFAGFFETILYNDVMLSTNPQTHTTDMVSWFPIVFPLITPLLVKTGDVIRVSFWREESVDRVWYEWCLESPHKTPIMNPNGRSYFIKKQ